MKRDERSIHKAIIEHLEARAFKDVEWIHINNNARDARHGAELKRLGSQRGAPDLLYLMPRMVIAHEIKSETGKLSKYQKEYHERLRRIDVSILVTYGLDDALKQLVKLGILRGIEWTFSGRILR